MQGRDTVRRFGLLVLLCLSMLVAQACTVTLHGTPGAMKSMEKQALTGGAPLTDSYGEYVTRLPGATLAGSVSHVRGDTPLLARPLSALTFDSTGNAPRLRFVPYEGACTVDPRMVALLQTQVDEVYAHLGTARNWRRFDVTIHLVPEGASVSRQVNAVRLGGHVSQRFYFPCGTTDPQRDIFHGVLTSLHETTHAMSAMVGHDADWKPAHGGTDEEEVLAEGGPACLYEELAGKDDDGLKESLPARVYLAGDWELDGNVHTASDLCQRWMRAFRAPEASQPSSAGSP